MIDITETERAALHAFALQYGYQWKSYLKAAWLSYKHNGKHMGGEDTGTLRAIRNQRGMRWLEKIRTADLEPPVAPAADQLQHMDMQRLRNILALLTEEPNGDAGCVALAVRVRAELERRETVIARHLRFADISVAVDSSTQDATIYRDDEKPVGTLIRKRVGARNAEWTVYNMDGVKVAEGELVRTCLRALHDVLT